MSTLEAKKNKSLNYDIYAVPIESFFQSAFSIDCVVFGFDKKQVQVLLIQRGAAPFENYWALPGDLVFPNEDLDMSATRILKDLTSLDSIHFEQVKTFGDVNRHPIGRVITVAYYAFVKMGDYSPKAAFWAKQTKWHPINKLPKLAFDHKAIVDACYSKLREEIVQLPIWKDVLPPKFTLTQLQELYEGVLDTKFDKGNFRKKINSFRFLKQLKETQKDVAHRPAALFTFDHKEYEKLKRNGHNFEL